MKALPTRVYTVERERDLDLDLDLSLFIAPDTTAAPGKATAQGKGGSSAYIVNLLKSLLNTEKGSAVFAFFYNCHSLQVNKTTGRWQASV